MRFYGNIFILSVIFMLVTSFNRVPRIIKRKSWIISASYTHVPSLSLEQVVFDSLQECGIKTITPKSHFLLLSVSGGVDSMALLHICGRMRQRLPNVDFQVVNFNHKARKVADDEVLLVKKWSSYYHMPFHAVALQNTDRVHQNGFQEFARNWRNEECVKIINSSMDVKYDNYSIVLAHHEDDQVETMMMKFLRGVHISNFSPMRPRRDVGHYSIIRPMLTISKALLINYMTSQSLEWSEDSSNAIAKYKRNKVRLDLIPILADIAGGEDMLKRRFMNLANQSADINRLLESQVKIFLDNHSNIMEYKHHRCRSIFISLEAFSQIESIVQAKVIQTLCSLSSMSSISTEFVQQVVDFALKPINASLSHRSLDVDKQWRIIRYSRPVLEFACKSQIRQPEELVAKMIQGIMVIATVEVNLQALASDMASEPVTLSSSHNFFSSQRQVTLSNIPANTRILMIRYLHESDSLPNTKQSIGKLFREKKVPSYFKWSTPVITIPSQDEQVDINNPHEVTRYYNDVILRRDDKIIAIPPLDIHNRGINQSQPVSKSHIRLSILSPL